MGIVFPFPFYLSSLLLPEFSWHILHPITPMPRRNGGRLLLGPAALSLLVFGTVSSLLGKVIYELKGPDLEGHAKLFRKPWASTAGMFVGMLLCLPGAALGSALKRLLARRKPAEQGSDQESLLGASESDRESVDLSGADKPPPTAPSAKEYGIILIPTVFDLLATVLMSVGLLYITASLYQMMRGAEVVFAALFSIIFLRRPLNSYHLAGILLCLVGISVVGMAGVQSGAGDVAKKVSASQMLSGMLLVVAAEAVQAAQVVVEDHFMRSMQFEPLAVVGYEGIFGTAIMAAVVLPVMQLLPGPEGQGLHENSQETLHMLAHSPQLQAAFGAYIAVIAIYNIAGMLVTDAMGAVTRTVLETLRTLLVWVLDLLLYYGAPMGSGSKLGEPWTSSSWLQAVGFVVLVGGTLVYGRGEEIQEEELRRFAKQRARERWGRIRASLPELTAAERGRQLTPEERVPMRAPRIAGPARIRTAFLPVLFAHRLQGLARPRWGAVASSSGHLHDLHEQQHFDSGTHSRGHSRRASLEHLLDLEVPHPHRPLLAPSRPAAHPHSLAEVAEAAVAAAGAGEGAGASADARGEVQPGS